MRIADKGFIPWLFWALFRWNGTLNRLPYFGLFLFCYVVVVTACTIGAGFLSALYILPPPEGAALDMQYIVEVLRSKDLPSWVSLLAMLPPTFCLIMIDVKRLRSVGLASWIAIAVNLAGLLRPYNTVPLFESIMQLFLVAYRMFLFLLPAPVKPVSDTAGGPRRVSGSELSNWTLIAPAPGKTEESGEAAQQEEAPENGTEQRDEAVPAEKTEEGALQKEDGPQSGPADKQEKTG